jgi:hypothetical protein
MKQYKTLKDFPGVPAGTILNYYYTLEMFAVVGVKDCRLEFTEDYILKYPDWFEENLLAIIMPITETIQ